MPALDGLTGIVLGGIFGAVFVFTCIISAIKAISDRSRMKTRIAVREKEKLENGYVDEKKNYNIEAFTTTIQYDSNRCQPTYSSNNILSIGTTGSTGSAEHLDLSVYSIDAEVDKLTFQHNNTNIQYAEENCQKLIDAVDIAPPCQRLVSNRDKAFRRERNLEDHWTDFLSIDSIEKIMRRRSYEIAVCENSWLSHDQPRDSPPQTLLDALNSKKNMENNTKTLKVAFENKAYDIADKKNLNYDYVSSNQNMNNIYCSQYKECLFADDGLQFHYLANSICTFLE